MRQIVAGLLMSLDGVVESPDEWGWPRYMDAEMSRGIMAGIADADAVLLGRRTYEQFAELWPSQSSEVPMADFLNNSPKYVVSSTLRDPLTWANSTVLRGDLTEELTRLKDRPGKNIQVPGSPSLLLSLLRLGLLDQLSVSICPVVVGKGARLFDGLSDVTFRVAHSMTLSTGVVGLRLEPAKDDRPPAASFPSTAAERDKEGGND